MKNNNIKSICFIIDAWYPLLGGGQVYVREVASRLSEKYNLKIDIITRKIKGEFNPGDDEINNSNVKVVKFGPKSYFKNPLMRVYFILACTIYLIFKPSYSLYIPQSILPGIVGKI